MILCMYEFEKKYIALILTINSYDTFVQHFFVAIQSITELDS